jgi:hypothetical protein
MNWIKMCMEIDNRSMPFAQLEVPSAKKLYGQI